MSKDPSTQVGAVVIGPDMEQRSTGFNGFPRGILDLPERYVDREIKMQYVVHAEMNAIANAARIGTAIKGCTMYLCATNNFGLVWGGPPCTRCTMHVIQAGISAIVTRSRKNVPARWHADLDFAAAALKEAGIIYREVE